MTSCKAPFQPKIPCIFSGRFLSQAIRMALICKWNLHKKTHEILWLRIRVTCRCCGQLLKYLRAKSSRSNRRTIYTAINLWKCQCKPTTLTLQTSCITHSYSPELPSGAPLRTYLKSRGGNTPYL
jgi:hypothetical protein